MMKVVPTSTSAMSKPVRYSSSCMGWMLPRTYVTKSVEAAWSRRAT